MSAAPATVAVAVPGADSVSTVHTPAPGGAADRPIFVYAPGAGSHLDDPFGIFASDALARQGIATLRFQFPYQERKKKRPDPNPLLEETWRAVLGHARRTFGAARAIVVGGRSMGGRIASQVVAADPGLASGVALFAYPLHPPKKPETRRDRHLPALAVPTLFCSGTNDTFGTPEELRGAASMVPRARLHLLEGADHGFDVKKSSGRTRADVHAEAVSALVQWLASEELLATDPAG